MSNGKIRVREHATGQEIEVWPVDARELIASGEYEAADEFSTRVAEGKAAFPMTGKARPTLEKPAAPAAAESPPVAEQSGAVESGMSETPARRAKGRK